MKSEIALFVVAKLCRMHIGYAALYFCRNAQKRGQTLCLAQSDGNVGKIQFINFRSKRDVITLT